MSGRRWPALALLVLGAGCHSGASPRPIASTEPGLIAPADPGATVVQNSPPREITWVDRHPLFAKPREYYDNSGNNKVVKTAAATVIGIPAGIFGEIKQIVVGKPTDVKY
jgi:hypothetical protein